MPSERDMERLVRQVTDLVLARMGSDHADSAPGVRRQISVLLPAPTESIKALTGLLSSLERGGFPVSTLVTSQVKTWLESVGVMASFPGNVQYASEPWAEFGSLGANSHVLFLGSLGFSFCGRLRDLNDEDPMVWMVSRALLENVPVLAAGDDLVSAPGATGSVAQRGMSILNDMESMGIEVLTLEQADQRIRNICASDTTLSRSFGQLLAETDVQQLADSGHRKIVLVRGAVVTPLARNKAAELGVELVETGR